MIFIDYKHEACNGEGCPECDWSGTVGECLPKGKLPPEIQTMLDCLPFAGDMQDARRPHRITLREVSQKTGIGAARLSEIEHAHVEPTAEEKNKIHEALHNTWPAYDPA